MISGKIEYTHGKLDEKAEDISLFLLRGMNDEEQSENRRYL